MRKGDKKMNSKWHLYISFIKSAIRIIACALSLILQSLSVLAAGMLLAELLGVLEEIGDKR
jgi:hypothetical protein